ncbi:MAG: ethanolamine ammonia-lyase subunit EutC [Desulfitobacteriaceae bacterium]|nr:ethanolamine ammonia-lyase subunit EutC [Desulfitobacteriaceae bacterium]MDD4753892.1 ethanolamine ammonia-lyase subunit EutC [Desulfitobacteriaceae bacterium]
MALEDNIKLIVEQVLNQINEKNKELVPAPVQQEKKTACPAGTDETILDDITQVDLQKYLQVPNPVNGDFYREMKKATPARIGVWRAGTRPLTDTLLRFRADHATAQDAVLNDVSEEFIQDFDLVKLQSACRDKDEFLTRPDLGRKLSPESVETLGKMAKAGAELQIIIADGLSSTAVETNVPDLLPALLQGLSNVGVSVGTPVFVKYGRVAVMDCIGEELKPQAAIMLIGERPGLGTAESLSAYLAYNPRAGMLESERTVVSNIHKGGTPPSEAGAHLSSVVKAILERKASGVNFSF